MDSTDRLHTWAAQLTQLHEELDALEARANTEALDSPLLIETFETLYTSVEELHTLLETVQQQQAELEAERARYRDLFAFAPDAYLVTDAQGKITEAN